MSRPTTTTVNTALPPRAPSSSSLSSRLNKKKSYLGRNRDSGGVKSRKASIKAAMNAHLDGCQSEHIPRTRPSPSPLDAFNSSWGDLQLDAPCPRKPCSWMNLDLEESFASFSSDGSKSSNTAASKASSKKKASKTSTCDPEKKSSSSSKRRKQKLSKTVTQKRAVGATAA